MLTAAHCVYGTSPHRLKVVLGDHNVLVTEPGEHSSAVCSVRVHPYYSHQRMTDDIALVQLCTPVTFSPHVQPVALEAPGGPSIDGGWVTVAGWGTRIGINNSCVTDQYGPSAFGTCVSDCTKASKVLTTLG